ncbi:MAG: hypothetical protein CMO81_09385 [Waddliaceae bacterium]|nr:hypothetical protein [Waddliaceae bacterium]
MTAANPYGIQNLPLDERPRERLLHYGAEALSSTELLAIILGSGSKEKSVLQLAQELLGAFSSISELSDSSIAELCRIKGIGPAKAIALKAAFALGMKAAKQSIPPRYLVEHPVHAYYLLKDELEKEKKEVFVVVLLDCKGSVIRYERVSVGTLSSTLVHPREVFAPAVRHGAASMILAHNHPSGDPSPSEEDFTVTTRLIEAARVLGVPIQDHLVIGRGRYVSLRQEGVCFE